MPTTTIEDITLKTLFESVGLSETQAARPMLESNFEKLLDDDKDNVSSEERFVSAMAAVYYNLPDPAAAAKSGETAAGEAKTAVDAVKVAVDAAAAADNAPPEIKAAAEDAAAAATAAATAATAATQTAQEVQTAQDGYDASDIQTALALSKASAAASNAAKDAAAAASKAVAAAATAEAAATKAGLDEPIVKALADAIGPAATAAEGARAAARKIEHETFQHARFDKEVIQGLIQRIDGLITSQLDQVFHHKTFQKMESNWTTLADLVDNTNFKANIQLSLLDITKDEAMEDLELNSADIGGAELFKKIYVAEYDQYGGAPYGGVVGLYDFANTPDDIKWLKTMGKICTASHAPFVSSLNPKFFGSNAMGEVAQLRDIEGMIDTPKYSRWNELRRSEEAAYIGLVLPRYIARIPYNNETNPATGINYEETVQGDKDGQFLWGNAAMLFARNLVKSFETSGWCQYIRGPKGGGLVAGLPVHSFTLRGETQLRLPVEITIPDFRELEFANVGVIPLVQKKGSSDAVFFSAQSIKKSERFKDPKDSENSQLVTNLSYTYSIARIAHYLKCIMRDNIGSTADGAYIYNQIDRWISGYVTALVNPDDLTLRYYPFKAYSLEVNEIPGKVGWYHCNLSILPHIQFEGLDVDLRVDARLG